ncbi:MAG TPA: hypothetical protein VM324_10300 [Egibacteraceae bacterium]|jgi:hypothetical protein|nr:hypothetical protein [Egibacteraceae bacterium]
MNTITVVSQLIAEAQLRFGPIDALEIPEDLWEPAMDEVADAGGEVGIDYCRVDGVAVRIAAEPLGEDVQALVHPAGSGAPEPLTITD